MTRTASERRGMLRSIVDWIAPRFVMAVLLVILGVAALRISELPDGRLSARRA
jgi:hypothetical protein